jgi:RNA polymerase sigma factor (sigma-70 family)
MLIDDDESLFARWCRGDRRAAQQLAQRYYGYLCRYFERRAHGNCEDLVQQTLLAVLDAGMRFRGDSTFRSYLLGTARNQLHLHTRQRKREATDPFECDIVVSVGVQTAFEAGADPAEYTWLDAALSRVSADLREVVTLAFWNGLSAPEISSITGVPLNTVYSRLRRAKQQLRQQYGDQTADVSSRRRMVHTDTHALPVAAGRIIEVTDRRRPMLADRRACASKT